MAYEMVMPYHLHMPSYFLETFTEYPYNTLRIRFINCLVWGIYRDLTNQDGKSQSLSCHNVLHL